MGNCQWINCQLNSDAKRYLAFKNWQLAGWQLLIRLGWQSQMVFRYTLTYNRKEWIHLYNYTRALKKERLLEFDDNQKIKKLF